MKGKETFKTYLWQTSTPHGQQLFEPAYSEPKATKSNGSYSPFQTNSAVRSGTRELQERQKSQLVVETETPHGKTVE